jgi:hypothetical protein
MKTSLNRIPALLAFGLLLAPSAASAQNLASRAGSVCRDLDSLTLLPGPGLLTPGRGISIPFAGEAPMAGPTFATSRTPVFRILATPPRGTTVLGALDLTPTSGQGIQPMGFAPPAPTAVPVGAPAPATPTVEALRFDGRLNPAPATLPIDARRRLKRD